MCPYLFVCGFDLSVWYQKLFDMICLDITSFCIICSFFFFYPILFQFHPCFLCFSLSIIFFSAFMKAFSNFSLPISLPLLPLFSFEEVNYSVASLSLQTCGNWCEPSWLPIQNQNQVVNHIEILKSFFLLSAFYLSHQNF